MRGDFMYLLPLESRRPAVCFCLLRVQRLGSSVAPPVWLQLLLPLHHRWQAPLPTPPWLPVHPRRLFKSFVRSQFRFSRFCGCCLADLFLHAFKSISFSWKWRSRGSVECAIIPTLPFISEMIEFDKELWQCFHSRLHLCAPFFTLRF